MHTEGWEESTDGLEPELDRLALDIAKQQLRRSLFGTLCGPKIEVDFSRPVWPDETTPNGPSDDQAL